jgi:AcrR family transcriptional regulator
MSGSNVSRSVRRTKASFRKALVELMRQKPIKDISVWELSDKVDMHRGTFYTHYKDVYDMVECIEKEISDNFERIINKYSVRDLEEHPFLSTEELFAYC